MSETGRGYRTVVLGTGGSQPGEAALLVVGDHGLVVDTTG